MTIAVCYQTILFFLLILIESIESLRVISSVSFDSPLSSLSACQSCSIANLSFINPMTTNDTDVALYEDIGSISSDNFDNCTRLMFSCGSIDDTLTIDYTSDYWGYSSSYNIADFNDTWYLYCGNDSMWHTYPLADTDASSYVTSIYCTDCNSLCSNYSLDTMNPNSMNNSMDAVNVTMVNGDGQCGIVVGCASIGAQYTIVFSDGTKETAIYNDSSIVAFTCQSNSSLLVYDNRTVVTFYCTASICMNCGNISISNSMVNSILDAQSYIYYFHYNINASQCQIAAITCSSNIDGSSTQVAIRVDDFTYASDINTTFVIAFCLNQQWMIYSPMDEQLHTYHQIECIVVPTTGQQCTNCLKVTPSTMPIGTIPMTSNGMSTIVYGNDETGCRIAAMVCTPSLSNLNSQVSIAADSYFFSSGIGIAAVQLTCNANRTWQINDYPQPYIFNNIYCIFADGDSTDTNNSTTGSGTNSTTGSGTNSTTGSGNNSTISSGNNSTTGDCQLCPDIHPMPTDIAGNENGNTTIDYSNDNDTNCRTAIMTCSSNNSSSQASIVTDDSVVFFDSDASISIGLICSSLTQWNVDVSPTILPFSTIQCTISAPDS